MQELYIYLMQSAQRRNKWICALKTALAEVKIFGPSGDPDAKPDPTRYTVVPWEQVQAKERGAMKQDVLTGEPSAGVWNLSDKNAVICPSFLSRVRLLTGLTDGFRLVDDSADVFGERDEVSVNVFLSFIGVT